MQRSAIYVGELDVRLIEEQCEISSREKNRINSIPLAKRLGKVRETPVLHFRALAFLRKLRVCAVDIVHLIRSRLDDFHSFGHAKEGRIDDKPGAEDPNSP